MSVLYVTVKVISVKKTNKGERKRKIKNRREREENREFGEKSENR